MEKIHGNFKIKLNPKAKTSKSFFPSFKSSDKYKVNGGLVFVTKLDRETSDFGHIIGAFIRIDGEIYKGVDVSTHAVARPCHPGLPICIKVEKGKS